MNKVLYFSLGTLLSLSTTAANAEVTSRACPYSCRTEGIPKEHCRDWREGDTCYLEDTRNGGAARSLGTSPRQQPASSTCTDSTRSFPEPRIEISDSRQSGNILGDGVKVRGTIEGACLAEAGYYERGELIERIPVTQDPVFKRYEFEVKARTSEERRPELRVYNTQGEREVVALNRRADTEGEVQGRYGTQDGAVAGRDRRGIVDEFLSPNR